MLKGEQRRLQRYAIESIPARVCEGVRTWFTILVLSAFILAKTPSEHTQMGFFLFLSSKNNAPKMHQMASQALFLPVLTLLAVHKEYKIIANNTCQKSPSKNPE